MAQAAKAAHNLLIPSPKELGKALTLSADRARRMAEAFGLKVTGIAPKPIKTGRVNNKGSADPTSFETGKLSHTTRLRSMPLIPAPFPPDSPTTNSPDKPA